MYWWQVRNAPSQTAPLGAASSHMSCAPNSEGSLLWSPGDDTSEDPPPPPAPPVSSAPAGTTAPASTTPLWSPGDDNGSEIFLSPPAQSAPDGLTTPVRGTPLWSPGDDDSEDLPPRQAPTAPGQSTSSAGEAPARGTPVGGLLGRALRREHYAPARVVKPILDPVQSSTPTPRHASAATPARPIIPGASATALIEAPPDTVSAPSATGRSPRVNWADNEVFQFNPEAHCLDAVPSASPHPEGMQYGPARRSSRACAKMLVRAGHRCPVCFCLKSFCSCSSERFLFCFCSEPGCRAARSHLGHVYASRCVTQAADLFFFARLEPLPASSARMSSTPDPTPHAWKHPHPRQWQVLYRSYSRRQRRLSRRTRRHRPTLSAAAQSVLHSAFNWLCACSPLAAMNPHRPGGGPRQHYRPDGSRRRTAGELAKRAVKAAARAAAAAADAAGGGAAKPAGPVVAKDGTSAGAPAQVPDPVTTAPLGVPSASTSTSASSTAGASTSAPKSGPAPDAYPSRVQHPPPSIAAGPKPSGSEHRTWLPALPALRVKAPPPHLQAGVAETEPGAPKQAPSPKRTAEAATLATDETGDPEKSTAEQEQAPDSYGPLWGAVSPHLVAVAT